ncbi:Dbl homology domain-containing protein [Umbelopsis sp. PMI_123]|nr:Dbl homology domain-containing protein [Umbelopsis sp. PMI_123]
MDASKRNSVTDIDVDQLEELSELRLTVSRRHSDVDLPDSPTDDEHSAPTTPVSSEVPYQMSLTAADIQNKLGSEGQSKFKRASTCLTVSSSPPTSSDNPLRSNSSGNSNTPHSRLCRYFCSEENSSLCPSKQKHHIETPISLNSSTLSTATPKNKCFNRSLFTSKKRRPVSAIMTPPKNLDDIPRHNRTQSGGDDSILAPTPSLDRSSSTSSTVSSHGSFHSDRFSNVLTSELSQVADTDSGSESTAWSENNVFATLTYSAPVSAASSPKLNPAESQRKGFFSKRANTQPVMTIDVKPSKGIKAAIRNKRETAVLKREAKAIHIWKTSTLSLLEAGPDEPTIAEVNKPSEKVEKDALMRRFIINEIYTTEKSYLKNLLIVKTKFMDPLVEAAKLGSPLLRSQDLRILFAHLADAIMISNQIIDRFEQCKEASGMLWRECPLRVGRIFKDLNDDMVCYVKYALDYHTLEKVLKRAVRNVEYRKFNQNSINNLETNRMGPADFLIMPIQRITRYGLLLKDLRKHTPVSNPDYNDLDSAIKMITGLAIAMNHAQKRN